jgi:hypothetical protein
LPFVGPKAHPFVQPSGNALGSWVATNFAPAQRAKNSPFEFNQSNTQISQQPLFLKASRSPSLENPAVRNFIFLRPNDFRPNPKIRS